MVLKYFSLPFTLFEPCGAVFIMNSKVNVRKNSLNEYFKAILHYFCVYSLSGFIYNSHAINTLSLLFFFATLAKVQVAVLSVLNLPQQGSPATCRIAHFVFATHCYLSQKYFAICQAICQPTVNRG